MSGASPSDSFDEALADMIHDGVDDLRNDLSRGHYEKDETKKVPFYSLTSIPGAGYSTRKGYFLGGSRHQEPITQSEQLPYARVTAFSRTSLFLEGFCANLEYLLNSSNQSAKPTDLKIIFVSFE